jgi:predicted dehydrogenase
MLFNAGEHTEKHGMAQTTFNRRTFLSTSIAVSGSTAMTAASYGRVIGANDRVNVGFIGYGLIGKRHVIDFKEQPDTRIVGIAETHRGRRDEAVASAGGGATGYDDFRKLLDRGDVDAVVVSTPDHWHALQTMMACAAGKDVYVEKPLTLFPREGPWMLTVARRFKRVVQTGTQQRSGKHYQKARDLIREGHIGKVVSVRIHAARNILPGYGNPADATAPAELDYDMWLGPAPRRAYNPNRAIYHFRWFWDYSGGQMTNLGQHSLDIVDWVLGVDTCHSVFSTGGRFQLTDNGETPDVQDALFVCDGWTAAWSHRECSGGEEPQHPLTFYGTKGSLGISRRGFTVTADEEVLPTNTVPHFAGAHPVGGPQRSPVKSQTTYRTKPIKDRSGNARQQFKDHVRNFLDCIKTREQPRSDLESGTRVATICHLANISLRLGRQLQWDSVREEFKNDEEASRWLVRPYRAPWDRELETLDVG